MTEFLLALCAFLLAHAIPPAPPVKARLVGLLGRPAYLLLYSVLSLALIVWLVSAAMRAPYFPLWAPAQWQAVIPIVIMPIAVWLVIAGLAEGNPLSVSIRSADATTEPGPIASVTRHPVLWGFLLWAIAHIPPTGHIVALILFGGMAVLALSGMFVLDRRARRRLGEDRWAVLAATAPLVPFAPVPAKGGIRRAVGTWPVAAAILIYLWLLLGGHRWLLGPDPLAWF